MTVQPASRNIAIRYRMAARMLAHRPMTCACRLPVVSPPVTLCQSAAMPIQKLRLKRGWSQQQLADASGLSVRTIQRIENGQAPSIETLKSLAAVFEVDFSSLNPEEAVNPSVRDEEEAFRYVRKLRRFYVHLAQYI